MKKTNVDLIVGASILTSLFILVAGVLWLKEASVAQRMVTYTVLFREVGTLQLGDPVFANGVKKGTVAKIGLRGTEVAVVLNVDNNVPITDSTTVAVVNVGLLGERGIGATLTSAGKKVPHNTNTDTVFIRGRFDSGISEAMGMLGTVLAQAETLIVNVADVLEATVADSSFIHKFHMMMGRLDTISNVTNRMLIRNEPVLNAAMADLKTVSSDLKALVDRNSAGLDNIVTGGQDLMVRGNMMVSQAESLVVSVQDVIKRIESGEGTLGKLYKNDEFYEDIKYTITNIDSLVNEIKNDALHLRVKIGFGKKKKK
ncbi:MAG: MlaD family protein [Chitinispirillales bacterium]|nr:MlaD family protein [Chitinispirillales bacterium]